MSMASPSGEEHLDMDVFSFADQFYLYGKATTQRSLGHKLDVKSDFNQLIGSLSEGINRGDKVVLLSNKNFSGHKSRLVKHLKELFI